uniref:Phage integrase family protein n=1 Tax=Klebsiella pneumoniae TaxID=573 RepID=A0A6H1PVE1_KLEPN|nr:phage integrase family protein [Klebsiella pneumoniae]
MLPVAIDYPAALALRQMALVQDELPKYLLAPEVSALLHYVPDLHRKMLLATLWNTGARINEALALTRGDFSLVPPYPFVQLATLKQRTEKAARTAGRAPAGSQVHRLVPLSDHHYVSQLQMMVATLKIRHCCKVSDEAAFCLIQRPYISKTLLTRRISPRGSP